MTKTCDALQLQFPVEQTIFKADPPYLNELQVQFYTHQNGFRDLHE